MKLKNFLPLIIAAIILLPLQVSSAYSFKIPTFTIQAVEAGSTVTIKTANFPANDDFNVLMGKIGTRGIGGIKIGTQSSGSGGVFTATYTIPESLKNDKQIAIRLESPTSGYYSYNWFYNNTTSSDDGYTSPSKKIPTFKIISVVEDKEVTIETKDFPANDNFNVTMGYMGTRGIGGTLVDTQASNAGGVFTATYTIPSYLHGQYQIAIRLQSPSSGYYSYNWFYNNSTVVTPEPTPQPTATPGPTPTPKPVFKIPTFSIQSVVRNKTVTIKTADFPADDDFTVRMGPMGTRGEGGIVIGTQNSGTGGAFTATYQIPSALSGSYQISIRLESPTSGYYSYNWFYNNTTP